MLTSLNDLDGNLPLLVSIPLKYITNGSSVMFLLDSDFFTIVLYSIVSIILVLSS